MSENQQPPPKVDPESLALRAPPRPVVRLNRRMLAVVCGLLAALVLGATIWSLQPQRRDRNPATELYNVDRVARPENLEQLPKDYSALPARPPASVPILGEPLPGDLGPAIVKAERDAVARASAAHTDAVNAERLARLRDAEEAAKSTIFFRSGRSSASELVQSAQGPRAPLASATLEPNVAQPPTARSIDPTAVQNRQDQKEAFLAKEDSVTRNPTSLQGPGSPYQVMAGTIIPAALVTGINSDLPGQVIASVTEPVYDTATGRHLLIPQGSRLIGRYDSQVAFGQRRVLLLWTRLVLPDMSSVELDRLPGIDPAGYAGLEDGADWHWNRILAGAALSTLLGIGAELAAPAHGRDDNRIVIATRDSAQESVNQVGQEITRRNLSIQPTLSIRPGFPMRVMVNQDLVLRPYQPLFFQRGPWQ